MELSTAVHLIKGGVTQTKQPQTWADLGAGTGLFANALSTLLATGSTIHAIDINKHDLQQIKISHEITLNRIELNFISDDIPLESLDGLLMANALHFVKNKEALFKKLKTIMNPDSRMVLIEYDLEIASQWVPYPVSFRKLLELAKTAGLQTLIRLAETPSLYNGRMYSALLSF